MYICIVFLSCKYVSFHLNSSSSNFNQASGLGSAKIKLSKYPHCREYLSMVPCQGSMHFLGSRVWELKDPRIREKGWIQRSSATPLRPCSFTLLSLVIMAQAALPLAEASVFQEFPSVLTLCVTLNEPQHLFHPNMNEKRVTILKILVTQFFNCLNGRNWNKMFSWNILGTEGSYLTGEVYV